MAGSNGWQKKRLTTREHDPEPGVRPIVAALACLLCGASPYLVGIDAWMSQGPAGASVVQGASDPSRPTRPYAGIITGAVVGIEQGAPACVGDCRGTNAVTIADLITLVSIALGVRQASVCQSGLPSGATVSIAVLVQSVNNALNGCPAAPPRTIEVDQYTVAAGATETVQSNVVITAHRGVEIMGDLLIDDRLGGDVTIIAEDGDIVIGGRVLASSASAVAAAAVASIEEGDENPPASTAWKASVGDGAAAGRVSSPNPRKGASFTFRAIGPNRDVVIRRFAVFQSGHGQDALEETVVTPPGARYQATAGSDGGDLIFEAPSGAIVLPTDQRDTDPPMFGLGDGGRGANLVVDRQFSTDETSLELIGGDGGASGQLVFDASTVRNAPAPSSIRWFDEGHGGKGGRALGDLTALGFLAISAGSAVGDLDLQLRELIVQGGRGGDGAVAGGDGGLAAFYAGNTLHRRGDPATALRCYGGDGGDVFPSPVPGLSVRGGDGGSFVAFGSYGYGGREGPGESRDGERGGDATGQGGKGGDILSGVEATDVRAGSGGHVPGLEAAVTVASEISFAPEIGNRPVEQIVTSVLFGVTGGAGGSAALLDCTGCPGGNAGNTGNAYAYGGDGGRVFASHGVAGMGGDTWLTRTDIPAFGEGGDGHPPGKGACPGAAVAEAGHGGNGPTLGPDGTRNLEPIVGECAPDGNLCGADLQCDATPTPTPVACTTDPPSSYMVTVRTDFVDEEQRDTETSSTNTYGCSDGMCGYKVITTFEDVLLDEHGQIVRDENGHIVYTKRMAESFRTGFDAPPDAFPHCTPQGMRVSAASGPVVTPFVFDGAILSRTTITCGGCECIDTIAGVPAGWNCCLISCPPLNQGGCPGLGPTARQAEDSTPEHPRLWVLRAPGDCP